GIGKSEVYGNASFMAPTLPAPFAESVAEATFSLLTPQKFLCRSMLMQQTVPLHRQSGTAPSRRRCFSSRRRHLPKPRCLMPNTEWEVQGMSLLWGMRVPADLYNLIARDATQLGVSLSDAARLRLRTGKVPQIIAEQQVAK